MSLLRPIRSATDAAATPLRPLTPRPVRRFYIAYATAITLLIILVARALYTRAIVFNIGVEFIGGYAATGAALVLPFFVLRQKIVRRFLRPWAGFVCPRCLYPLVRLPDVGNCPECGTPYTRAAVVALWEQAFRLKNRYPRNAPSSAPVTTQFVPPPAAGASAAPTAPAANPLVAPAWSSKSLRDALIQVEAVARRHGFAGARFAAYLLRLDAGLVQLGKVVPSDLHAFLGWFDPSIWHRFVGAPDSPSEAAQWTPAPDHAVPDPAGIAADAGPRASAVRIHVPDDLRSSPMREAASRAEGPRRFLDNLQHLDRPAAWADSRVIEFAAGPSGEPIFYCVDPPDLPPGSIITFLPTHRDRLWLADSLAQWLARLSACDGIECAFHQGHLASLAPPTREAYQREFHARNPRASTPTISAPTLES